MRLQAKEDEIHKKMNRIKDDQMKRVEALKDDQALSIYRTELLQKHLN
jgi:hypothetical protein